MLKEKLAAFFLFLEDAMNKGILPKVERNPKLPTMTPVPVFPKDAFLLVPTKTPTTIKAEPSPNNTHAVDF